MKYWFYYDGGIHGPHTPADLISLPAFDQGSLICPETSTGDNPEDWRSAEQVAEISNALSAGVGGAYDQSGAINGMYSDAGNLGAAVACYETKDEQPSGYENLLGSIDSILGAYKESADVPVQPYEEPDYELMNRFDVRLSKIQEELEAARCEKNLLLEKMQAKEAEERRSRERITELETKLKGALGTAEAQSKIFSRLQHLAGLTARAEALKKIEELKKEILTGTSFQSAAAPVKTEKAEKVSFGDPSVLPSAAGDIAAAPERIEETKEKTSDENKKFKNMRPGQEISFERDTCAGNEETDYGPLSNGKLKSLGRSTAPGLPGDSEVPGGREQEPGGYPENFFLSFQNPVPPVPVIEALIFEPTAPPAPTVEPPVSKPAPSPVSVTEALIFEPTAPPAPTVEPPISKSAPSPAAAIELPMFQPAPPPAPTVEPPVSEPAPSPAAAIELPMFQPAPPPAPTVESPVSKPAPPPLPAIELPMFEPAPPPAAAIELPMFQPAAPPAPKVEPPVLQPVPSPLSAIELPMFEPAAPPAPKVEPPVSQPAPSPLPASQPSSLQPVNAPDLQAPLGQPEFQAAPVLKTGAPFSASQPQQPGAWEGTKQLASGRMEHSQEVKPIQPQEAVQAPLGNAELPDFGTPKLGYPPPPPVNLTQKPPASNFDIGRKETTQKQKDASEKNVPSARTGPGKKLFFSAMLVFSLIAAGGLGYFFLGEDGSAKSKKASFSTQLVPEAGKAPAGQNQTIAPAFNSAQGSIRLAGAPGQAGPAAAVPIRPAFEAISNENTRKALEIVKNYKLSGGRGTVAAWFANSFLSNSATGSNEEWSATILHGDIFVVQYRLLRPKQDPLIYQFEVAVDKGLIVRGINNSAIELLDFSSRSSARSASASKSRGRNRTAAKARKQGGFPILPLPAKPAAGQVQEVPTGFETAVPDSEEKVKYIRAQESDEELF